MTLRDSLKRLSSDSIVYGLGQVSGKAVNLLLVPFLTRTLLPQQYGVADLVIAYSASLLLVLVLGMDAALARFFYQEPDRAARIRMVSSSFYCRLFIGGAAALLITLFSEPLAARFIGGAVYAKYLRIGAAAIPLTLLVLFSNDVLRVTFQPWKFIFLNVTQTLLVGGLTVWFVFTKGMGVAGVLYGKMIGDGITAVLGLTLCRHALRLQFSRSTLTKMLTYSLPMVPAAMAFGVIGFVDREALQRSRGLDAIGIYTVAMKFFAVITMLVQAFHLAFGPFAYSRAQDKDAPLLYARVLSSYLAVAALFALIVGLFAPWILALLVDPGYDAAARPALWLAFAGVAQGAFAVTAIGISLSMRTTLFTVIAIATAAFAWTSNQLLVPRFGAEGAAMATCASYLFSSVLAYIVAQRLRPMPYRGAKFGLMFLLALGLALVVERLSPSGTQGIAVRVAAVLGFGVLVFASEFWSDRGAVRHASSG